MVASHRIILYLCMALLILAGVSLFFFRAQVLDSASPPFDLASWMDGLDLKPSDLPSEDIFQSPVLASLNNYTINFDFDNICWRPDTVVVRSVSLAGQDAGDTPSSPVQPPCTKGSGQPFFISQD